MTDALPDTPPAPTDDLICGHSPEYWASLLQPDDEFLRGLGGGSGWAWV